ncbi:sensor histidine kinase [Desulfitobacterium chlororespirans]|uniref:histidine kinase n=1 Tax=Desulfitobacterium chlororespirans DSM 11544 TaxID=1121395 RepID=A0A1M7TYE0_9FIRM|nr:HAMP domain-containing sensor histidine kinase [Desulfitobacterium chlororespirans]SHN75673.1 histidine kinase [Desulfitobacterium chlororespirans DSM 11544]
MVKNLQKRFIAIAMLSLLVVMVVVLGSLNLVNVGHITQNADGLLATLAENEGRFPPLGHGEPPRREPRSGLRMTEETPFETRYFLIRTNKDQSITEIDTSHIAGVSSTEAMDYAQKLLKEGRVKGYWGQYRYLIAEKDYGNLLILMDCSRQINTSKDFLWNSIGIALISLLILFVLVSALSRRAIRPVIENMERQKQFITDAGHEIKTPLAIIAANSEVLELTNGKNEWTQSIQHQVKRLDELVKNLLTLAKMDEGKVELTFENLSFSDLVEETAGSFTALGEKKGLEFVLDIQPGLLIKGEESSLRYLVTILVDNGVKYAAEHGQLKVSLKKRGKTTCLEVYNTCDTLPEGDLNRLFDRFARGETSRSRESGGYGIGLSVAQAIVTTHHGKITVEQREQGISFMVII